MGMTVEFYSADPPQLITLFATENNSDVTFFEQLKTYPVADFSFHLWIPDDLDSLCQAVSKQSSLKSLVFRNLLVKQLWYDGEAESLALLSEHFALTLASLKENEIERAALDWTATFPYQEPPQQTPAYRALWKLQEVARDAVAQKKSLIFHLVGNPSFFRW